MMNTFMRYLCCIIVLGLWGCQSLHQDALDVKAIEHCKMTCSQHFEYCKQYCTDNCPTCSAESAETTERYFTKYVDEKKVEGKKLMRELNSYRDPLQCRKVTCDCMSDLAICTRSCTVSRH